MKKYVVIVLAVISFSTAPLRAAVNDFDPKHITPVCMTCYPPYAKLGSGVIDGYLKAETKTFGEVVYPDVEILLMPNTNFSAWYIKDVAYMIEKPYAKDALSNYPVDLVKYTRSTHTNSDGYFKFTGLPDGAYVAWAYVQHEEDSHPLRERSQLAYGADGTMVTVPTYHKGLKIKSDDVVVASATKVQSSAGDSSMRIDKFFVIGEFTCCSAEI